MISVEGVNPLTEAIQLAIAPVFLLTGVAGMLNALGTRLARVVDRARALEEKIIPALDPLDPRHARYLEELRSLDQRRKVINGATALMVICAVFIGLTVVELFYATSMQDKLQLSRWVSATFLAGFACFIAACVLYLVEILLASKMIKRSKT